MITTTGTGIGYFSEYSKVKVELSHLYLGEDNT